jgi:hypothetical protein
MQGDLHHQMNVLHESKTKDKIHLIDRWMGDIN